MFILLTGLLLILRLGQIQLTQHREYASISKAQVTTKLVIPALRGGIYDRNGTVLAMSVPTKTVIADNFQIKSPGLEAKALAPLLGMPVDQLTQLLKRHSGYVPLGKNVSAKKAKIIARNHFPGITMIDNSRRVIPNGTLAQSVLGTTNFEGKGSGGLEYGSNALLAGKAGSALTFQSPLGIDLPQGPIANRKAGVPGKGLEVTLDQPLQYKTEQALGKQLIAANAVSGSAIVMNSRTGEILSMANLVNTEAAKGAGQVPVPAVGNPVAGLPGISQAMNNLAVTQVYEPGSVFKLVAFSAALDDGVINPKSSFQVPYAIMLDGKRFHDAEMHPDLTLSATDILAQSSNIGTYQIAAMLGEQRLLAQVERLGFGQLSGLNFPGESSGLLKSAADWQPTDIVSLPIGQVDASTPLQVLDAYNAVATGGIFIYPKLLRATVDQSGKIQPTAAASSRRVFSAQTSAQLSMMFRKVVSEGTGTLAQVPGYSVAGKTGTSQIPTPNFSSYIKGAYNATFVGMAPAENPVLTTIVVIQRPTPVIFGGSVAAPVFSQIMSYALHHYHIPPTMQGPQGNSTAGSASVLAQDIT